MRSRKKARGTNGGFESGFTMSEYIVVSLALVLALVAAANAVNLLIIHHERASATMQLPL